VSSSTLGNRPKQARQARPRLRPLSAESRTFVNERRRPRGVGDLDEVAVGEHRGHAACVRGRHHATSIAHTISTGPDKRDSASVARGARCGRSAPVAEHAALGSYGRQPATQHVVEYAAEEGNRSASVAHAERDLPQIQALEELAKQARDPPHREIGAGVHRIRDGLQALARTRPGTRPS
jgi:hypothetical protein